MTQSNYVIPFSALMRQIGLDADSDVASIKLTRDQLLMFIRKLLVSVSVDESWYRATYPDVDQGIKNGIIASAKAHFVTNGYFEGRLPSKIVVDEEFYISRYHDVAESIDDGEINSAQEHFEAHGFSEGRLPFEI